MRRAAILAAVLLGGAAAAFWLTRGPHFTDAERQTIASLSLSALPKLPPDPTNRYADEPAAAALGATLFFDTGMSRNGQVACATCHLIDRHFQDDRKLGQGIGTTDRRTMPLAGVARSPWFFWDGRKDSLWSQALEPLEKPAEHGGNRTAFAHMIAGRFKGRYERIFGPLPDLAGLPENASPLGNPAEQSAWAAMPESRRAEIDRVFANIGKAIAAFERSIAPETTRFDRFADALGAGETPQGDARFTALEVEGLKLFIGPAQCVSCHNGPRFTDDHFHNTGVPGTPGDHGRAQAVAKLTADPFNCLGAFSDGNGQGCDELKFMLTDPAVLERAFKPPSLRGAASRPPYMHAGQFATLDEVLDHYSRAPVAPSGTTELHRIVLTDRGRAALIAFLKTLDEAPK